MTGRGGKRIPARESMDPNQLGETIVSLELNTVSNAREGKAGGEFVGR